MNFNVIFKNLIESEERVISVESFQQNFIINWGDGQSFKQLSEIFKYFRYDCSLVAYKFLKTVTDPLVESIRKFDYNSQQLLAILIYRFDCPLVFDKSS